MMYIEKEGLPSSVNERIIGIRKSKEWKNIPANNTVAIRNVFNNEFPKEEVKKILIHEQHGLCAYCMRRIRNDGHSRIEHWSPLSKDKENAISYTNMLGVCDGGEKIVEQQSRILCCDAHKKEMSISLTPLDKVQMDKIAYKPDGRIYTEPFDVELEKDINEILLLNGVRKADGSVRDTDTEILKGRRDVYSRARRMMSGLEKKGKCTSAVIKKIMEELYEKEEREEFVGVKLYYFSKKYDALVRRGL